MISSDFLTYRTHSVLDSCSIGTVEPKQEAKASVEFVPTAVGSSVLMVSFDSDKLRSIKNSINIIVKE